MPKKFAHFLAVALLLLTVIFQATSLKAFAQTPPVTGPITAPVTPPITSFNLTGKVIYKQLGRLLAGMQRVFPAEGVVVKIRTFFGNSFVTETSTDENGMYGVNLPPGTYRVIVSDNNSDSFFVPPFRFVTIKAGKTKEADFQGLLFPHF